VHFSKQAHPAIQKAAKSGSAFHMNEAFNGLPLNFTVHNGSHPHYNNLIQSKLDNISPNATPEEAYDEIVDIIMDVRNAVQNNPNTPIQQLNF